MTRVENIVADQVKNRFLVAAVASGSLVAMLSACGQSAEQSSGYVQPSKTDQSVPNGVVCPEKDSVDFTQINAATKGMSHHARKYERDSYAKVQDQLCNTFNLLTRNAVVSYQGLDAGVPLLVTTEKVSSAESVQLITRFSGPDSNASLEGMQSINVFAVDGTGQADYDRPISSIYQATRIIRGNELSQYVAISYDEADGSFGMKAKIGFEKDLYSGVNSNKFEDRLDIDLDDIHEYEHRLYDNSAGLAEAGPVGIVVDLNKPPFAAAD